MRKHELKKELERLSINFDEESLRSEIRRAQEDLEAHATYLDTVKKHLELVKRTVIKPVPYLSRAAPYSSTGKVSYYIGVHWEPQVIPLDPCVKEKPYCPSTDCERLEGGDRFKEAVARVLLLAKEHGVRKEEILVEGFRGMVNPVTGSKTARTGMEAE